MVEEENDKENRRNNIILYNVLESSERNVESKHEERQADLSISNECP